MNYLASFRFSLFVLTSALALAASACNDSDPEAGAKLGQDVVTGQPSPLPSPTPGGGGSDEVPPGPAPELGAACGSSDSNHYCLALKYVVYENSSQTPVVSSAQALANLAQINSIWSQCNIAFQIDDWMPTDPRSAGLSYNTPSSGELTSIRRGYGDNKALLVVTTGAWSGSLGAGSANAWTNLPGFAPYGAILEAPVGDYPNIIAHELGHYLNLDHTSSSTNVMSALIYVGSTKLTSGQCQAARSAIQAYWKVMLR